MILPAILFLAWEGQWRLSTLELRIYICLHSWCLRVLPNLKHDLCSTFVFSTPSPPSSLPTAPSLIRVRPVSLYTDHAARQGWGGVRPGLPACLVPGFLGGGAKTCVSRRARLLRRDGTRVAVGLTAMGNRQGVVRADMDCSFITNL